MTHSGTKERVSSRRCDEDHPGSLNPFFNNSTNWYKHVFRPGRIYNANIQTSGGTETINYMIGAGFYKEEGIMPGSNFVRGNILTTCRLFRSRT